MRMSKQPPRLHLELQSSSRKTASFPFQSGVLPSGEDAPLFSSQAFLADGAPGPSRNRLSRKEELSSGSRGGRGFLEKWEVGRSISTQCNKLARKKNDKRNLKMAAATKHLLSNVSAPKVRGEMWNSLDDAFDQIQPTPSNEMAPKPSTETCSSRDSRTFRERLSAPPETTDVCGEAPLPFCPAKSQASLFARSPSQNNLGIASVDDSSLSLTPSTLKTPFQTPAESLRTPWDCCNTLGEFQNLEAPSSSLQHFGIPPAVEQVFARKKITRLYDWQTSCLSNRRVLDGGNIIFCAPTSGGKSLVAEILMMRNLFFNKQRANREKRLKRGVLEPWTYLRSAAVLFDAKSKYF